MGLITETNEQYYAGQQAFVGDGNELVFTWSGDVELTNTTSTNDTNFYVTVDGNIVANYTMSNNSITFNSAPSNASIIVIKLQTPTVWDNLGSYAYVTLTDIVNNFMVAYVGMDKLIPRCKRSDIIFHAKRGLQEFSYDTLKSVNSQEVTIPPSLSIPIPQDYVNYVQLSWVDQSGVKRVIYPTTLTSNPTQPIIQDSNGDYTQNSFGQNNESAQSVTDERWKTMEFNASNNWQNYAWSDWFEYYPTLNWFGQLYGQNQELAQRNGWFTINEREGKFSFSSDLASRLLILEYISDGLAYDMDSKIPKMAEEAIYMHIAYSILSTRSNVQEYIVQRFKKDRRAQLRNAKIRLSNIKLNEFTQVMRGKSKWIKH